MAGEELFAEERAFFAQMLPEWLAWYEGKWVVIKGRDLCGVYDTRETAFREGLKKYGYTDFLIQQVLKVQPVANFPALSLGLLNAGH